MILNIKKCVVCDAEFNSTGRQVTCGKDCSSKRANWRQNQWYKRQMATDEGRSKIAHTARKRYKEKGRSG